MADYEIRTFDDPVLRKKAKPVLRVNRTVRALLDALLDTMRYSSGVGLAAPQIGVSKRLAVVDVGEGPHFLVNPEIISRSEETISGLEGCLSWPGYVGQVERPAKVTVRALDRDGHEIWVEGEGFLARALCHEIDHLDGALFVDRAEMLRKVEAEAPPDEDCEEKQEITCVFMGSPEFAVPSLDELVSVGVKVVLAVTQPARPYGRKRVLRPTPVEVRAAKYGIPVLACPDAGAPDVVERVKSLHPDYVVVAAFGHKLPKDVIEAARKACLNVHPSLLPKWRGANPVQRAVIAGEKVTGVSIMHVSTKMDAGDIALQKKVSIGTDESYGTLETRLANLGAHALVEAMRQIESGEAQRAPQDEMAVTVAGRLRRCEDRIDWRWESRRIHDLVRGLNPKPGATTCLGDETIKVWETRVVEDGEGPDAAPGTILGVTEEDALVMAGDGVVAVRVVQPCGGKIMTGKDYLMGRKDRLGCFGEIPEGGEG